MFAYSSKLALLVSIHPIIKAALLLHQVSVDFLEKNVLTVIEIPAYIVYGVISPLLFSIL